MTATASASTNPRTAIVLLLQLAGGAVAFLIGLILPTLALPMAESILAAAPARGFLPPGADFLFNAAVNGVILVWAARRSSYRGLALVGQLTALSFGAQIFMTQIETAYFLPAFPLLQGNFELYGIVARGFLTSLLVSLLVTGLVGGFSRRSRPPARFVVTADGAVKATAWLAAIYVALYFLFGYFVAWQSQEVRLFYGGPEQLNSFAAQLGQTLVERPEIPAFQYFRGVLWILCLLPLFSGFTGKRGELVLLSGLALGLLPTAQLAFANPLMPSVVSLYHFWEVAISTGIFGALCAWRVPAPAVGRREDRG